MVHDVDEFEQWVKSRKDELKNRVVEIEKGAAQGDEMPEKRPLHDCELFIAFRGLYHQYRGGFITKDQAKREKRELISAYEHSEFHYNIYLEDKVKNLRMGAATVRARKEGCSICQEMATLYDGVPHRPQSNMTQQEKTP